MIEAGLEQQLVGAGSRLVDPQRDRVTSTLNARRSRATVATSASCGRAWRHSRSRRTSRIAARPGQSHTFSLWLRSASGDPRLRRRVALWASAARRSRRATVFTVGGAWQLVSATLSVATGGHSALRAEVYIDTPGVDLFLDGAQLVNDGLANAGFDQGFFRGWDAFPRGALAGRHQRRRERA